MVHIVLLSNGASVIGKLPGTKYPDQMDLLRMVDPLVFQYSNSGADVWQMNLQPMDIVAKPRKVSLRPTATYPANVDQVRQYSDACVKIFQSEKLV